MTTASQAEKVFFWSMETETADVFPAGSDSTPTYYPPKVDLRKTTQAYSGKYSLDVSGGEWRAATFDNPTNDHIWATPEQGAIVFWWKYTGEYPDSAMLFQLTGKSRDKKLDTNDGLSVRLNKGQISAGYGWVQGEKFGSTSVKTNNKEPLAADKWYKITFKWNKAGPVTLSLQIDDQAPVTTDAKLGDMGLVAFHQILIGNDRKLTPAGLFIDDFTIYSKFEIEAEPAKPADPASPNPPATQQTVE
jgi:hypothetical protein